MGAAAFDVGNEADATGVVLLAGVVEALSRHRSEVHAANPCPAPPVPGRDGTHVPARSERLSARKAVGGGASPAGMMGGGGQEFDNKYDAKNDSLKRRLKKKKRRKSKTGNLIIRDIHKLVGTESPVACPEESEEERGPSGF